MIMLWLVIGGILYILVTKFIPGFGAPRVRTDAAGAIILTADRNGNYEIGGAINGVPVEFIVDTGASKVSVSQTMATQMGLSGCLPSESSTANGNVAACIAIAHNLEFGNFRMTNVPVSVMPHMDGMALLGMNALGSLHITQSNGQMVIAAPTQ
ncbi:MAG: retroviral-like aspartic protease family protein [Betaproteobacteria bacterium]|nr:retroviral-like aspartic protease family protein [Betaproteobacteria bacterium]